MRYTLKRDPSLTLEDLEPGQRFKFVCNEVECIRLSKLFGGTDIPYVNTQEWVKYAADKSRPVVLAGDNPTAKCIMDLPDGCLFFWGSEVYMATNQYADFKGGVVSKDDKEVYWRRAVNLKRGHMNGMDKDSIVVPVDQPSGSELVLTYR